MQNTEAALNPDEIRALARAGEYDEIDRRCVETGELSAPSWWEEKFILGFILFGALGLTAIIIPYRTVHIPWMVMLMAAMMLGLASVKFALENFSWLMVMLVIYGPFQKALPGDFGGLLKGLNVTNVLLIFLVFGWLASAVLHSRPILRIRWIDTVIFLFMMVSTVSLIRAYVYYGSAALDEGDEHLIFPLKRWLEPMIVYYIFVNNLPDRRTIRQMTTAALVTIALCTLIVWKQFYLDKGGWGGSFSTLEKMRTEGIADQPNQMAAFFCYYSFYYMGFWLTYLGSLRCWGHLVLFLMSYQGMHLTFSRGGQIGFFVATYLTPYYRSKKVFFGIMVPLAILLYYNPELIPARFVGRLGSIFTPPPTDEQAVSNINDDELARLDNASRERIEVWKAGLLMIEDNPLLGVGFNSFHLRIGDYNKHLANKDAHNTYISIAAEMGVIALVIFLAMIYLGYREAKYVYSRSRIPFFRAVALGYLGGTIGLLVSNMFGTRLSSNEVTFYFWIFTAIIVRLRELTEEEERRRATVEEWMIEPVRPMLG